MEKPKFKFKVGDNVLIFVPNYGMVVPQKGIIAKRRRELIGHWRTYYEVVSKNSKFQVDDSVLTKIELGWDEDGEDVSCSQTKVPDYKKGDIITLEGSWGKLKAEITGRTSCGNYYNMKFFTNG